jgi:hypothetical protein
VSNGLGMRIIQRLVTSDLHGEFSIGPSDCGSTAILRFPRLDNDVEERERSLSHVA